MKKINSFLLISVIMLFRCSILFAQEAIIYKIEGKAEILIDDKWEEAETGAVLISEQKIRTKNNSICILIFEQGHQLYISENTTAELEKLTGKITLIGLDSGKVRARVRKLKKLEKFDVKTPTGLCAVRGTEFSVEYIEDIMQVEVYEGIVSARERITGSEVLIRPGESTVIEPNSEPEVSVMIPSDDDSDSIRSLLGEENENLLESIERLFYTSKEKNEEKLKDEYRESSRIDSTSEDKPKPRR